MANSLPARLILFDGVCNLCNGSVQFIIKHDPQAKFYFTALQSAAGQNVLDKFNLPQDNFSSFIYIRQGVVLQKSTAALYVLKDLGGGWKLLFAFIAVPKPLRNFVYNLVAKYRYRLFGKRETCMVPDADLLKRFLA